MSRAGQIAHCYELSCHILIVALQAGQHIRFKQGLRGVQPCVTVNFWS